VSSTIVIIQLLNAIFYAAVLFLIAAGLSLIYGVMRVINLAHGTLYALGAYISAWAVGGSLGAVLSDHLGLAGLFLLLPAGAIAVAALGALLEPLLLRPFYRRPEEYHLLATFGLLMILEDVIKYLFGGTPLIAGSIMDRMGSIPIGRLLYPTYNLFVVAVGLAAAFAMWWLIYRTRFGVMLRATSQDRRMAAALGINVGRIYVQAFAIGCFMAGLGGAVVVPAQAAVLGMGVEALVLAFVVVVIGGLGSLEGAFVGALIVSLVRTAGIQFFAEIELAVLYLIATAVLLVRPTGLFGRS
jgi:branched-chain amino acid transport system permease protein